MAIDLEARFSLPTVPRAEMKTVSGAYNRNLSTTMGTLYGIN